MPAGGDAAARSKRATALRRQIARLKDRTSGAVGRAPAAEGSGESPQEFVERRMREIARARSARKKSAKKTVAKKKRSAGPKRRTD